MNTKYFEHIVVYLSVMLVCVVIALLARIVAIQLGADDFTAHITFWVTIAFCIILYAILAIMVEGLFTIIADKFFPKQEKTNPIDVADKNLPSQKEEKIIVEKEESSITVNLETIREQQKQQHAAKEQAKRRTVIRYTQQQFAPYTSDEELERLCNYVEMYSSSLRLEGIKPIRVKTLTTLDLFHFGWNIWNFFRVGKQDEISVFLKQVFAYTMRETEIDSIKRHLRDDEKKGIITISKDLSTQQEIE